MTVTEPTTMLTDFALAALGVGFGARLIAFGGRLRQAATVSWGWGFLALAIGAAAGGVAHGFAPYLSDFGRAVTWKLTTFSIGFTSFFMLVGTATAAMRRNLVRIVAALAVAKLVAYLLWMSTHDEFRYVIYDYVPSMLLVLALSLYVSRALHETAGAWLAAGVVVSLLGAGVQLSGVSLHRHFNHNDLYHVVQMAGLALLYQGARRLRDR